MFGFRKNKQPKMFVTDPIQMCPAEFEALVQQARYYAQQQEMQQQQQQQQQEGGNVPSCPPTSSSNNNQTIKIPIGYDWTPTVHHHHQMFMQPTQGFGNANFCGFGNFGF